MTRLSGSSSPLTCRERVDLVIFSSSSTLCSFSSPASTQNIRPRPGGNQARFHSFPSGERSSSSLLLLGKRRKA
ncbi:hypothetical protein BJX63DRAFT_400911 [Aspergillus granulosus]|uniref:Uncharacterized protein n=1 Tax=Aspergillus granulosus TaxID=176169 RepID=A0ABR4H618_9EURO